VTTTYHNDTIRQHRADTLLALVPLLDGPDGARACRIAAHLAKRLGLRPYQLIEAGVPYDIILAASDDEAVQAAADNLDADLAAWADDDCSIWVEAGAWDILADCWAGTVERVIDPPEQECDSLDGHDWQHVRSTGAGAGVVCREQCSRCGLVRVTDTGAQRPDGGLFTSISYELDSED
jgi:hypothetical protein